LRPLADLPGLAWLDALPVLLFARSADGRDAWLSAHWLGVMGAPDLAALHAGASGANDPPPWRLPAGEAHCRLRGAAGAPLGLRVRVVAAAPGAPAGAAWFGIAEPDGTAGDPDFLAFASHELRSPLNAIRGWSHVLRKSSGELNAMQQKALDTIDRSVSAQARLIDDLLDRQRLLRGQAPLEPRRLRLADLLGEALQAVQPAADEKSIVLALEVPDDLWLDADPKRLAQAVDQLLAHGLKHTPPQGRIALAVTRANDGRAQIALDDGALGFDADALREAFAQPAKGLGLARRLVEMHGGRLEGRAAQAGTSFRIDLPAVTP
jgi:signal transduction histidine kinase